MDRCERAKIDLSSRSTSQVYVPSFFRDVQDDDFDEALSQAELEAIVKPLLEKGLDRIENLLARAGFSGEQVALCVATGGMSNMPAVKRHLHELFGPERVRVPDGTATMIAEGAAWIGSDRAGLQLARNVELVLARNSYLPLVKAGTRMPREGEVQTEQFHLYCTDPRDGLAKFQVVAPRRPGNNVQPAEPRENLETLTVKVDPRARVFEERLELEVRITDDLILEAHARSLNARDEERCEIHSLEFGLAFPGSAASESAPGSGGAAEREHVPQGALSVRANLATSRDKALVPGELMYSQDPVYFDSRCSPPEVQVRERLYYVPCARCGRIANDPACRCSDHRRMGGRDA